MGLYRDAQQIIDGWDGVPLRPEEFGPNYAENMAVFFVPENSTFEMENSPALKSEGTTIGFLTGPFHLYPANFGNSTGYFMRFSTFEEMCDHIDSLPADVTTFPLDLRLMPWHVW